MLDILVCAEVAEGETETFAPELWGGVPTSLRVIVGLESMICLFHWKYLAVVHISEVLT